MTLTLFDAIDAVQTMIGLRKGHQERNPCTKRLIEESGANEAMLLKSLLPIPASSPPYLRARRASL
jgi:hypothetical protein